MKKLKLLPINAQQLKYKVPAKSKEHKVTTALRVSKQRAFLTFQFKAFAARKRRQLLCLAIVHWNQQAKLRSERLAYFISNNRHIVVIQKLFKTILEKQKALALIEVMLQLQKRKEVEELQNKKLFQVKTTAAIPIQALLRGFRTRVLLSLSLKSSILKSLNTLGLHVMFSTNDSQVQEAAGHLHLSSKSDLLVIKRAHRVLNDTTCTLNIPKLCKTQASLEKIATERQIKLVAFRSTFRHNAWNKSVNNNLMQRMREEQQAASEARRHERERRAAKARDHVNQEVLLMKRRMNNAIIEMEFEAKERMGMKNEDVNYFVVLSVKEERMENNVLEHLDHSFTLDYLAERRQMSLVEKEQRYEDLFNLLLDETLDDESVIWNEKLVMNEQQFIVTAFKTTSTSTAVVPGIPFTEIHVRITPCDNNTLNYYVNVNNGLYLQQLKKAAACDNYMSRLGRKQEEVLERITFKTIVLERHQSYVIILTSANEAKVSMTAISLALLPSQRYWLLPRNSRELLYGLAKMLNDDGNPTTLVFDIPLNSISKNNCNAPVIQALVTKSLKLLSNVI